MPSRTLSHSCSSDPARHSTEILRTRQCRRVLSSPPRPTGSPGLCGQSFPSPGSAPGHSLMRITHLRQIVSWNLDVPLVLRALFNKQSHPSTHLKMTSAVKDGRGVPGGASLPGPVSKGGMQAAVCGREAGVTHDSWGPHFTRVLSASE